MTDRRRIWQTLFKRRRRTFCVLNWSQILLILRFQRLINRRRRFFFFWDFRFFEFVENCVNLEFFLQIEIICEVVLYFIEFMTNEMRMIRTFSLLFVDVFSTISRFYFVVERIFIFSFLVSASFFIERRLEIWRTIVERHFERLLSFSCCFSNDLSKSAILFWWWVDFDNSLTQNAASIWTWWINELYAAFQCTKSADSRDYLKKRWKLASIAFLFALRSKKATHDENDD